MNKGVSSVRSLSRVWLFATLWIAAHQASLSITNSRRLLKFMSIEPVMPSKHLIHLAKIKCSKRATATLKVDSSHVWMWKVDYEESWVLQNWCFWIVVLEKTLRVPWAARRSNQSILKEISPECSLEGLMMKLKLQYFGHLMWRVNSLEKTLTLGKIEGGRKRV